MIKCVYTVYIYRRNWVAKLDSIACCAAGGSRSASLQRGAEGYQEGSSKGAGKISLQKGLATEGVPLEDHSLTAQEAKLFSLISGPLTFLTLGCVASWGEFNVFRSPPKARGARPTPRTSIFAMTAAYLEVQNGWMLAQPLGSAMKVLLRWARERGKRA